MDLKECFKLRFENIIGLMLFTSCATLLKKERYEKKTKNLSEFTE